MLFFVSVPFIVSFLLQHTHAINLDLQDQASVKNAAKTIVGDIVTIYNTTDKENIGIFEAPYYWWEAGSVWDSLINYWFLTGDDQYNEQVAAHLSFQVGQHDDFMPVNQTKDEVGYMTYQGNLDCHANIQFKGNDDQATWALAAMTAEERGFPVPTNQSSWLSLASNVLNDQIARWDNSTCHGGLRWQIFTFLNGYDYKNSLSNGNFLHLAARLARYTGNATYATWANESYTWMQTTGLISSKYDVWDSTEATTGCTILNHIQWTGNVAPILAGAAVMANITNGTAAGDDWHTRTRKLLNASAIFWRSTASEPRNASNVLWEPACETAHTCGPDQLAYKGLFASALAQTAYFVPELAGQVLPVLQASASAAAASCAGRSSWSQSRSACGESWRVGRYDGSPGLSQEVAALDVVLANLVPGMRALDSASAPNATSGGGQGTSTGAGSGASPSASGTGSAKPKGSGAEMVEMSSFLFMGSLVFWIFW